jgi:hypothetical protein
MRTLRLLDQTTLRYWRIKLVVLDGQVVRS